MTSIATPIDGNWRLLRAELDGEIAAELAAMEVILKLSRGEYAVKFNGRISDEGTFALADVGLISRMVLHGVKGPNAGRTIPCIYQHRGNLLRLCYGLGGESPTEFTTSAGQKRYLATYKREDEKSAGVRKPKAKKAGSKGRKAKKRRGGK